MKGVVKDGDSVNIYAPDGFLDHAVSENFYAGAAMNRRAVYMYGGVTAKGRQGPGGQRPG